MAGFFPVQTIYTLIRLAFGKSQPPDCVPPREAIPDILHGSYLLSEQSPASSHTRIGQNLPTRLIRITKFPLAVKREFCIIYRLFRDIFVQNADCGKQTIDTLNIVFSMLQVHLAIQFMFFPETALFGKNSLRGASAALTPRRERSEISSGNPAQRFPDERFQPPLGSTEKCI